MTKILNIFVYYILLFIGLIAASWIIWSRFIRKRTIRDIPDDLLTEYRFWILLYICGIYFYVVKNLIKEKEPHIIIVEIGKVVNKYVWKPMILLDHLLKYNKYCKTKYYNFMINIQEYWDTLTNKKQSYILLGFQIIPRIFLVIILFLDTFYFNKLELFYKIILIGVIPFLFRYIEYSFNDFMDNLIERLTNRYSSVHMFEKGYSYNISRKDKTDAIWHFERVSIEEYIEIMFQTELEKPSYSYVGDPCCKEEVYREYEQKFNKSTKDWTLEHYDETYKLFEELYPQIYSLKITVFLFQRLKKQRKFVWSKIVIFSIYLICWGYILIISYYHYPIELVMFKYLINNLVFYLMLGEDPFTIDLYSLNENLITIESVKNLIRSIIQAIKNRITK